MRAASCPLGREKLLHGHLPGYSIDTYQYHYRYAILVESTACVPAARGHAAVITQDRYLDTEEGAGHWCSGYCIRMGGEGGA